MSRHNRDRRKPPVNGPILNRPPDHESDMPLPLIMIEPDDEARRRLVNQANAYLRTYRMAECSVIVTREFGRWHLSIAHPRRLPTWREVSQARYRVVPDNATMVMILPPKEAYVNVHRFCFQLVEIDPASLVEGGGI